MPSWPKMNPDSASALVGLSILLACIGPIATSRAFNFVIPVVALVLALAPAVFGNGRTRLLASIVLAVSLLVSVIKYPGYKAEMERWSARAEAGSPNSERPSQP